MVDKEVIRDRIRHETELMRTTIVLLVVTMGGTMRLAVGAITPLSAVLVAIGLILSLVFTVAWWRQQVVIRRLLTELERGAEQEQA